MPKTPVKIARRPNQLGGSSSSLIFGALYGTSALGSLGSEEEEMDTALEPGAIFFVSGTLSCTGYCRNGGQVGLSTSPKQFNWRPSAGVLRSSVLREASDQAARRRNGVQVTCRHRTQRHFYTCMPKREAAATNYKILGADGRWKTPCLGLSKGPA
jgi:hypothetical protein